MQVKEFFKRWKQGIVDITPFQQARITYFNTWIMLLGMIAGIIVSIWRFQALWWLIIVLVAASINILVVQAANRQKYIVYKNIESNLSEKGGKTNE